MRYPPIVGLLVLLGLVPAIADAAESRSGEKIYSLYCEGCHRPDAQGPGTVMLRHRYGDQRAVITANPDLDGDYVKVVVRNGLIEMAPFRKTDITDDELTKLVDYLLKD